MRPFLKKDPTAFLVLGGPKSPLSDDAFSALKRAHDSEQYRARLFSKMVGGKHKLLVLLGETHVKNKEAAALGKEVVKHFKTIGVEGVDFHKQLGGNMLDKLIGVLDVFFTKNFFVC